MTEYTLRGQVAIVGVAESALGKTPDRTVLSLQQEAALGALDDAGLALSDVDGLFVSGYQYAERPAVLTAEYLGIQPRYLESTNLGGSGFVAAVERAGAAIAAGLCETVLICYGSTQYSSRTRALGGRPPEWSYQFEVPHGPALPLSAYALAATRHMYLYGTTSEQLAEVAVAARQWAMRNPKALRRAPLTVDEVLASPLISSPLRGLDCWHEAITNMPELTETPARASGALAFARAGVRPHEVDVVEVYDSFTITVILTLEDLGFCRTGEGGAFVSGGRIAPDGDFPLNTSGGGLSYTHPGMFGIFLLIEAVRQLRSDCGERQVANARTALCHGTGGQLSTAATVILGREA
ncbi:MAG: thiolase [Chloroflexi bacterium]|nr:MAG: thiolase [Chloroflexota bacterium]